LHRKDLPGTPDVVLPRYRIAVQVNGCFWHRHDCPKGNRHPSSNVGYWGPKLVRNKARQAASVQNLLARGWKVVMVWECDVAGGISDLLRALRRERTRQDTCGYKLTRHG
jgi:DNA mismatch endonuclease (patch repair protein)